MQTPKVIDPYMEHGTLYIKYRRIALALIITNVVIFTTFGILFWRHLKSVERLGSLDPVQVNTHIASLGTQSVLTPDAPSSGLGTMIEGAVRMHTDEDVGISFAYPSTWGIPLPVEDDSNVVFRFVQSSLRLTAKGLEPQTDLRNCTDIIENGFFGGHLFPEDCVTISISGHQIPVVTVGLFQDGSYSFVKIAQIQTSKGLYYFIAEDSSRFSQFLELLRSLTFVE